MGFWCLQPIDLSFGMNELENFAASRHDLPLHPFIKALEPFRIAR